ncbi:MAG: phosphatidate cytidylyltransferase [Candidatus Binatia bacterium]
MEANLRLRLATALVGIPLLIALVGWGHPWLFASVIVIVTFGALREFFLMAFPGRGWEQILGMIFGLGVSLWLLLPPIDLAASLMSVWLVLLFSIYLFRRGRWEERFSRLSSTLLGAFYIGYLFPHWVTLFRLPDGRDWVFFVLLVVMAGDSAAYIVGRRYGRKKLAPELSPGKTLEGALGYVAGSLIAGGLGGVYLLSQIAVVEAIVIAGVLGILGQLGDLFESFIKRVFAVKEAGTWLPGHGGFLDRVDSLIFPVVFTSAYVKVFHL